MGIAENFKMRVLCLFLGLCAFISAKNTKFISLDAKQCEGTVCPGAQCCPEVGWFCCSDGVYCAKSADNCPYKVKLIEMGAVKQCDGPECPFGCCPFEGWVCCEDGVPVHLVHADEINFD